MKRNDELGQAEFTIQSQLGTTTVTMTPQSCRLTPADVWLLRPAGEQYGGLVILDPQDSYAEKARQQRSLRTSCGAPAGAGTASRAVAYHAIRRMHRELDQVQVQARKLRDQIEAAEREAEPPAGTLVWATHSNDIGDWCPWSGEPVADFSDDDGTDFGRCPAGCRGSWADEIMSAATALHRTRQAAERFTAATGDAARLTAAARLAEQFALLDQLLRQGGEPPADWPLKPAQDSFADHAGPSNDTCGCGAPITRSGDSWLHLYNPELQGTDDHDADPS